MTEHLLKSSNGNLLRMEDPDLVRRAAEAEDLLGRIQAADVQARERFGENTLPNCLEGRFGPTTDCPLVPEFHAWMKGRVRARDSQKYEAHKDECEECGEVYDRLSQVRAEYQEEHPYRYRTQQVEAMAWRARAMFVDAIVYVATAGHRIGRK